MAIKDMVLEWLAGLSGAVVSGQHLSYYVRDVASGYDKNVVGLYQATGKWVGLVGTTYGLPGTTLDHIRAGNKVLIDYWNQGGLVTIDHHARNPWTGKSPDDLTGRNLVELIDPSSAVYKKWMADLDQVAAGLAELRDAGVVVLWRPFHEMTWWKCWWWDAGAQGWDYDSKIPWNHEKHARPFIDVWIQMFNYFTYEKGLDNLLWVYCAANTDKWSPLDRLYPGGEYVDLVGVDVYDDAVTIGGSGYQRLVALGKPLILGEVGSGKVLDGTWDTMTIVNAIRERYPGVVSFMAWHSWAGHPRALVDNRNAAALLNDPLVVTRDEVPTWGGAKFSFSRVATWKRSSQGKAVLVEVDGREVDLAHADLSTYNSTEKMKAELERQAKRALPVFIHINRDGSLAVATGAEPERWPEDELGIRD